MNLRQKPYPANDDHSAPVASTRSPRLLEWLNRLTQPGISLDNLTQPPVDEQAEFVPFGGTPNHEDWHAIGHICGYGPKEFSDAASPLPLTAAEIEYFRRNHRGTENHASRDFLTAQCDLPSPLAELYGLYRHRVRIDVESALWIAQSTGSTRLARTIGDLLTIGAFANGIEFISFMGVTYSVPAAFDTAVAIDLANAEALRRLAYDSDDAGHLLKLSPDALAVLASTLAEHAALSPTEFLEKANKLAEARQDVVRLPSAQHFATAISERDLPLQSAWAIRMASAFARIFPSWVANLPELHAILN